MREVITLKYEVGNQVFHITPESNPGIITAWRFQSMYKEPEYLVAFSADFSGWYSESELSPNKVF